MATLTVNIEDKKSEKAVKAVLDALGVNYIIEPTSTIHPRPLNNLEEHIYIGLKDSLQEIKLYREGKVELSDAKEWINEL